MVSATNQRVFRYARLALTVLVVAACSGGGTGGGAPTSPTAAGQNVRRITISNLKIVQKSSAIANRPANYEITVQASDAGLVIGGVSRLRLLTASETPQGQTPAPEFISLTDIKQANVVGGSIKVLMTVKLPAGRHRLGFSVFKAATASQTVRSSGVVQANADQVESNEAVIPVVKITAAPAAPAPAAAPAAGDLPVVSIGGGSSGSFFSPGQCTILRVTRTGSTANALDVFFHVTGTAILGVDFTISPGAAPAGKLTIPAGSASANITVCSVGSGYGTDSVIVTLDSNISTYTVGVGTAQVQVP